MDGIINIYKPLGMTSHDVVYRVRRVTGIRKVGHTGTLDPDAEGVLPICIGKGTKAADLLTASDKGYTAVLRLGVVTDTQDMGGTVLETAEVTATSEDIRRVAGEFVGTIAQIPPMYSAVKVGGKRLYQLARQGVEVERKPREITIHSIDVRDIAGADVTLDVHCSKGTYIRTLCHDIGARLGCGGAMAKLIRTRSGRFSAADALPLEQLTEDNWRDHCTPVDHMFPYPKVHIKGEAERRVLNGNAIGAGDAPEGETYRVYGTDGRFLCLSQVRDGMLCMVKSFY